MKIAIIIHHSELDDNIHEQGIAAICDNLTAFTKLQEIPDEIQFLSNKIDLVQVDDNVEDKKFQNVWLSSKGIEFIDDYPIHYKHIIRIR